MWGTATVILLVVCFFYLFIFVDPRGSGVLPSTRRFLYETLPSLFRSTVKSICGQRALDGIDRLIKYVCFSKNPLVQIMYVLLAGGGFVVYVIIGFNKYIPTNPYVHNYHRIIGTIIMILCYASFLLASLTSPGQVTKKNLGASKKKFPFDGVVF